VLYHLFIEILVYFCFPSKNTDIFLQVPQNIKRFVE